MQLNDTFSFSVQEKQSTMMLLGWSSEGDLSSFPASFHYMKRSEKSTLRRLIPETFNVVESVPPAPDDSKVSIGCLAQAILE